MTLLGFTFKLTWNPIPHKPFLQPASHAGLSGIVEQDFFLWYTERSETKAMKTGKIYIGVIGSADCGEKLGKLAFETGRLIAGEGWILVCGGMGGVMEHSSRGAREEGGVVIGILPGTDRGDGNQYLTYALPTGLGHVRNTVVVSSCDALIAIGGGFGTLSEISFANIRRIPVVGLESVRLSPEEHISLFRQTASTPAAAVEAVKTLLEI